MLAVSLVVSLALAEAVVRLFFPLNDGRTNLTLEGQPIEEWFEPGSVYRQVSNEYDARTTITPRAHRVPGTDGSPEVILLGDSFTYGYGLADDETFASFYCGTLRVACANLGYPGSGTARQVRRLEEFIDRYQWHPREVKLFFFGMSSSFSAGNDFVDNYDFSRWLATQPPGTRAPSTLEPRRPRPPSAGPSSAGRPRADDANDGLSARVIAMQGALLEHSMLMRRAKFHWGPLLKSLIVRDPGNERMTQALEATRDGLAQLDALSRKDGFSYTIYLIVPVQDLIRQSYGQTLEALNSVSPKPAVPTAQLFTDSPASYYFSYDGHLNVRGARRLGEFLVEESRRTSASR